MSTRRIDPRGQVAVVSASCIGPDVTFLNSDYAPPARRMVESLRRVAHIWAQRSGGDHELSFPRMVWVQERAGQWEAA